MAWFARGHTSPNALNTVLVKLRVATEKRDPFDPRLYRNESIERVFMAAKWQRGYRERVTGGNVEKANPGGLEILQDRLREWLPARAHNKCPLAHFDRHFS